MNHVIRETHLKTNHKMKRRPRENAGRVKKSRRRSERTQIGKPEGGARSLKLGRAPDSRLSGQQSRKSRYSVVLKRISLLLDEQSLPRASAGNSEGGRPCPCTSSFPLTVVLAKSPGQPRM